MKLAPTVIATLLFLGCGTDATSPSMPATENRTIPSTDVARTEVEVPRGSGPGKVWGMVIDWSGVCVDDATVTVLDGPLAGLRVRQATPCDVWWVDGGFWIEGLFPGFGVTVRASAPGYADSEQVLMPSLYFFRVQAIELQPLTPDG
jgi:hypothetical protein